MSAANDTDDNNTPDPDDLDTTTPDDEDVIRNAFAEGLGEEVPKEEPEPEPDPQEPLEVEMDGITGASATDELGDMTDEEIEAANAPAPAPDPAPDSAADALAAAEEEKKQLQARLRKLEGMYGELNRNMQQLREAGDQARADTTAVGDAAPTATQVTAALADGDAMKSLREEFPEFASAMDDQLGQLAQRMPDVNAIQGQVAEQVAAGMQTIVDSLIEDAHEGWKETVQTPEFDAWLGVQDEQTQALVNSNAPRDAIRLLDEFAKYDEWRGGLGAEAQTVREDVLLARYAESSVESRSDAESANRRQRQTSRLQAAVTPTRGVRSRPEVKSESQIFEEAYNGK